MRLFFSPCIGEFQLYAIIATGGKQYRVQEGDHIKVEQLTGNPGEAIEFNNVLLLADGEDVSIGSPLVEGSKVMGEVQEHARAKKIDIIKFKRRKHHIKRMGHRQHYTNVKITSITK